MAVFEGAAAGEGIAQSVGTVSRGLGWLRDAGFCEGMGAEMGIPVVVELDVKNIAQTIMKLKKEDKETLLLLLSRDGKELSKRYREVKSGKVKTLLREQVFKDVLQR